MKDRMRIFEHVCEAIAHAHQMGIIHRDLKPANIMVGSFDEVQVMDWGLGKDLHRGQDANAVAEVAKTFGCKQLKATESLGDFRYEATQFGTVLGTPAHMPPEQRSGQLDQVDRRSDVFSLGSVLAAILTDRPAYPTGQFATSDLLATHGRIRRCKAPRAIRTLATDCLAADPQRRPADAAAVHRRLVQINRWRRRRFWTFVIASCGLLFCVAAFELLTIDQVTIYPTMPAPHYAPAAPVIAAAGELIDEGQFDAAERLLRHSVGSVSGPEIGLFLGEFLRDRSRLNESESVLRTLQWNFPKNERIALSLAETLRRDGRVDEAVATLRTTSARQPQSQALQRKIDHLRSDQN